MGDTNMLYQVIFEFYGSSAPWLQSNCGSISLCDLLKRSRLAKNDAWMIDVMAM